MSNLLRIVVVGPGLRRSDLVVNYMVSYSAEDRKVSLAMTDTNGHTTRVVTSREDASSYQVSVTHENSLDTESFSLATVLADLVEPEEWTEPVAPPAEPADE